MIQLQWPVHLHFKFAHCWVRKSRRPHFVCIIAHKNPAKNLLIANFYVAYVPLTHLILCTLFNFLCWLERLPHFHRHLKFLYIWLQSDWVNKICQQSMPAVYTMAKYTHAIAHQIFWQCISIMMHSGGLASIINQIIHHRATSL